MTAHDDDAEIIDEMKAREDERIRQLILARRNRFMAAALAGAGVALNGCWDSGAGGGGAGGAGGEAGAAGETATGGASGAAGTSGVGVPMVCLTIPGCGDGTTPPCVCLGAPVFDDGGVDEDAGIEPPRVCLSFE